MSNLLIPTYLAEQLARDHDLRHRPYFRKTASTTADFERMRKAQDKRVRRNLDRILAR